MLELTGGSAGNAKVKVLTPNEVKPTSRGTVSDAGSWYSS